MNKYNNNVWGNLEVLMKDLNGFNKCGNFKIMLKRNVFVVKDLIVWNKWNKILVFNQKLKHQLEEN